MNTVAWATVGQVPFPGRWKRSRTARADPLACWPLIPDQRHRLHLVMRGATRSG